MTEKVMGALKRGGPHMPRVRKAITPTPGEMSKPDNENDCYLM